MRPPIEPGLSWHQVGAAVGGRPAMFLARVDGGSITLLWMDTSVLTFRFVPGYLVPEGGPVAPADSQPTTWVPHMVAAFNGAFLLRDHAGGYFYRGRVVAPLTPGLAALEVTSDGRLAVGVWGRDLGFGPTTVVVRENLPPLVDHFVSQTKPSDAPAAWGYAIGNAVSANRSALGERADGSLIYAFGTGLTPAPLAAALVLTQVRTAMVLDMNRAWPGASVYTHAVGGIVGQKISPGVLHDPSVYLQQYRKDFLVALRR